MNRMMMISVGLFVLAGCATKPVSYAESKPIPEDRIYSEFEQYSRPDATRAKVSFTRDSGMLGAAASLTLFINGELVARIRRKESVSAYLPAGSSQIALGPGNPTSGPVGSGLVEDELLVETGEEYFYRVGLDTSVGLVLERIAQGAHLTN